MAAKVFGILLILGVGIATYLYTREETIPSLALPSSAPSISITASEISTSPKPNKSGIQSAWVIIRDMEKLSLHSNLVDQLSAKEAKEKYGCSTIISGGFYSAGETTSESRRHLGLFVANGEKITDRIQSSLFNGIFSLENGIPTIGTETPQAADIALQTGPLLITSGNPRKLTLTRDENARRMVAAVTPQNHLVFIALYDASSYVSGPTLEDLPKTLDEIDRSTSLDLKDAINLDGGSHSAFINDEIILTDIQTPGSYFCVTN